MELGLQVPRILSVTPVHFPGLWIVILIVSYGSDDAAFTVNYGWYLYMQSDDKVYVYVIN